MCLLINVYANNILKYLFLFFTVYHMKSTGWVHITDQDCKDLHYAYAAEKAAAEQ